MRRPFSFQYITVLKPEAQAKDTTRNPSFALQA
jgi:hypothetical protein